MNGQINIKINSKEVTIVGGGYRAKPIGMLGIKLAREIDLPCVIDLPIADFSIPNRKDTVTAIARTIGILNRSTIDSVYVGCMGGYGRTGIFLSLLTKLSALSQKQTLRDTAMLDDPITWVRNCYVPSAVETEEQENFVNRFDFKLLLGVSKFL